MSFFTSLFDAKCQYYNCHRDSLPGLYRYYCEVHECPKKNCYQLRPPDQNGCRDCLCRFGNCKSLKQDERDYCYEHLCLTCKRYPQMGQGFYRCQYCKCKDSHCDEMRSAVQGSVYCSDHLCMHCMTTRKNKDASYCNSCLCQVLECGRFIMQRGANYCENHRCRNCGELKKHPRNLGLEHKYCEDCECHECGNLILEVRCEWPKCPTLIKDRYCEDCRLTRFCKKHECRYQYCHERVKVDSVTKMKYVTCRKCHSMRGRERCSRPSIEGSYDCKQCHKKRRLE